MFFQKQAPSREIARLDEVFTPSTPAQKGFVPRTLQDQDLRQQGFASPGAQIVVWGESGAGKSSLVNRVLVKLKRTAVTSRCTPDTTYEDLLKSALTGTGGFYVAERTNASGSNLGTTGRMGSGLLGYVEGNVSSWSDERGTARPITAPQLNPQTLLAELGKRRLSWVIEDFHKAPRKVRGAIAHGLKVFSDEGFNYPHTSVVVIGVSDSVDELFDGQTNLGGRVIDVQVPPLTAEELGEVLTVGENLLNLDFSTVRSELLDASVGLASVTHALAQNCCNGREIVETVADTVSFTQDDYDKAVATYIRTRMGGAQARVNKALRVDRQRKFNNPLLILSAMSELPAAGAVHADILREIQKAEPDYGAGNLAQYLKVLQTEARGSVLKKSENTVRFSEPLLRAYIKFKLKGHNTEAPEGATDSFDRALSQDEVLGIQKEWLGAEVHDVPN